MIIEQNGTLYPIEIKKSANPNKSMIENFEVLKNVNDKKIGEGAVICMYDNVVYLDENNRAIPFWYV